jgi:hypothetical protein
MRFIKSKSESTNQQCKYIDYIYTMKLTNYKFFRRLLKGNWYQNRYFNDEKGIKLKWERKEYKLFDTWNIITIKTERYKKSFCTERNKRIKSNNMQK